MLLSRLVEKLADHTAKIDELMQQNLDLSDWRALYLVLHTLQIHAQVAIDFLLHTCSLMGVASSTPMRCVERFVSTGLLGEEEGALLKRMIRPRSIVVHEYGEIDTDKVREVLRSRGYRRVL